MTPSAVELAEFVRIVGLACKEQGVRSLRVGELQLEFGAVAPVDPATVAEFQRQFEKGMPTDEEMLFHSAPGGPPVPDGAAK